MSDTPTYTNKKDKKRFYNSTAWKRIRAEALERDKYECTWCRDNGRLTIAQDMVLEIDHIQEIETHPERALDLDNLRTLCRRCHNKRHNRLQYRQQQQPKKADKWKHDECFD